MPALNLAGIGLDPNEWERNALLGPKIDMTKARQYHKQLRARLQLVAGEQ